ncbi:MAG: hypothetical protein HQK81_14850 [Desulfovibrionaceae bacterium]|nr:hypothetical protein [Desulfovibrionaceae bacterium]MBF0515323.1 hypothetical protein [Desulfovibrionaceae bacterium]
MALGKGLKGRGELFKKTEADQAEASSSKTEEAAPDRAETFPAKTSRQITRKSLYLAEDLSERLRLYCFQKRKKENTVISKALEAFLIQEGF